MDDRLIQRTRYLLRTRFRAAQSCPDEVFEDNVARVIHWVIDHPVLGPAVGVLRSRAPDVRERCDLLAAYVHGEASDETARTIRDAPHASAKTFEDHPAVCFHITNAVGKLVGGDPSRISVSLKVLGGWLVYGSEKSRAEDSIRVIRDIALDGLFEYLDEHLDSRNAIFGILLKYKKRSEWFHRGRLRQYAADGLEGCFGERALAVDLNEYLVDQGVDFTVEESTASGRPDLMLREAGGRHIVVDAKYIKEKATPADIRRTLAHGFHQVMRYCHDVEEPHGFLVVFTESTVRTAVELESMDGIQFLAIGGRTVFYLPILIGKEPSASKLGVARDLVISADELRQAVKVEAEE